jgi:AcrR family transcriptional regulator
MDLKEELIQVVIEEFNEKGIKFTMDDIARRLGVSKRTIYSVVEDKETLFMEAVDCVFTAIKESEAAIIQDESLELIEKIKKILIVLPQKYEAIDFRQLYECKVKFPRIYAKIEHWLENDWEPTLELIKIAIAEGLIKNISLPVFQAMVSGTMEYCLNHDILITHQISYAEALHQMVEMIMHGVKKEEDRSGK